MSFLTIEVEGETMAFNAMGREPRLGDVLILAVMATPATGVVPLGRLVVQFLARRRSGVV